ncbi:hypothetical protein IW261DRAFT_1496349 [Armillaria novae-zelandiae]|uniref:Uncharacterized protein n=1 Tax=Armillaria novae-zelandiae TaxID=153914 RepID=A0AA39P116_9AGAR|nr:hypothetical protein IW261DRAFT_1496349 [Armillaria novae-zelandiae]
MVQDLLGALQARTAVENLVKRQARRKHSAKRLASQGNNPISPRCLPSSYRRRESCQTTETIRKISTRRLIVPVAQVRRKHSAKHFGNVDTVFTRPLIRSFPYTKVIVSWEEEALSTYALNILARYFGNFSLRKITTSSGSHQVLSPGILAQSSYRARLLFVDCYQIRSSSFPRYGIRDSNRRTVSNFCSPTTMGYAICTSMLI